MFQVFSSKESENGRKIRFFKCLFSLKWASWVTARRNLIAALRILSLNPASSASHLFVEVSSYQWLLLWHSLFCCLRLFSRSSSGRSPPAAAMQTWSRPPHIHSKIQTPNPKRIWKAQSSHWARVHLIPRTLPTQAIGFRTLWQWFDCAIVLRSLNSTCHIHVPWGLWARSSLLALWAGTSQPLSSTCPELFPSPALQTSHHHHHKHSVREPLQSSQGGEH